MDERPTFRDVEAAARRIKGAALRTPVMTSRTADAEFGAEIFFKCETFQRTGAFKFRGAFNALSKFDAARRAGGVVAYSSGNHAQAIARAAEILGIAATIVMPEDAPAAKMAATRGYGAEVVTYDRYTQDRDAIGRRLAEERGMTLVPPFDHADIVAGQGTAAMELIEEVGPLDCLFVCLGGGGLLSGSALSAGALSPGCAVYGVEPESGNDGQQSFRRGEIVRIDTPKTIADGAQTTALGRDHLRHHPRHRRGYPRRVGRRARRLHALLRLPHEDGRGTDRLPRPGGRAADAGRPRRQARRRDRQRRQCRHGSLRRARGPTRELISRRPDPTDPAADLEALIVLHLRASGRKTGFHFSWKRSSSTETRRRGGRSFPCGARRAISTSRRRRRRIPRSRIRGWAA